MEVGHGFGWVEKGFTVMEVGDSLEGLWVGEVGHGGTVWRGGWWGSVWGGGVRKNRARGRMEEWRGGVGVGKGGYGFGGVGLGKGGEGWVQFEMEEGFGGYGGLEG
ncbi:uncharacterized protein G2W53_014680 [Senna tora]|uniref:Uncharacterized protein n=1 Tax=Senna tora TaxID=362788 RepID=A0A834WU33_9FABA|nr:uncharacterized protein G2W53_014680 [Senna tora]